jgi:hypothetical protein
MTYYQPKTKQQGGKPSLTGMSYQFVSNSLT